MYLLKEKSERKMRQIEPILKMGKHKMTTLNFKKRHLSSILMKKQNNKYYNYLPEILSSSKTSAKPYSSILKLF